MDGALNPHDEYVETQWVDLGSLQQHGGHPMYSPHHQQAFGVHYGFCESPGFAPPESPLRLQESQVSMQQQNYMVHQWSMAPQPSPITTTHQHYQPPQAIAPAPPLLAPAAVMATSNVTPIISQAPSGPRRTLTDTDRRRMCIFHEENPNVKQTEIGAMFGVERSTVSKVLRQKEKYLYPDDGSRSPVKRSRGKFPDIERALSVWAKNTRKQGIALTDVMIREKARFFATSVGISDSHFKANSAGWLEKFKHKNSAHGGRARAESDVTGLIARRGSAVGKPTRPGHTRTESTPNIKREVSSVSPLMEYSKSQDSQKNGTDSPDSSFMDFTQGIESYLQQSRSGSTASLASTFTNSGYLGPSTPASPFFSDSAQPSPGFPAHSARIPQRPRSQTMPLISMDAACLSPPPSSGPMTPKMMNQQTALASPLNDIQNPLASPTNDIPNPLASPRDTPSSSHTAMSLSGIPETPMSNDPPTRDDAKQALEVVMSFLRQQPLGFIEQDEYVLVSKLLGKFELSSNPLEAGGSDAACNNLPP